MKKIESKSLFLLICAFIVTYLLAFFIIDIGKKARLNVILDTHTQTLQTYYEILKYNQTITADVAFEETVQNKKLMDVLSKANLAKQKNDKKQVDKLRDEAITLLEEKYELLKKKGILQYHFVFPDNKVFLRMHKISKYGDDLSSVRSDFNYTNSTQKIIRGFAQGRTAHAFRNVYPIINKAGEHLGAVEISFSSDLLQNYFTQINKIHTHFLVRKDIFKSKAWHRDDLVLRYMPSAEHPNFMITMTDNHSKGICVVENSQRISMVKNDIVSKMSAGKGFSVYTIFQEKARVVSFYPIIHSITKEPIAWIVSYRQDSLIDKTLESYIYAYIILFVILFVIFAFIYYMLNQKNILNEMVKEKTSSLSKANKELEEQEHELELLNQNLEEKIKEEVSKNRDKDKVLYEQTKMAALGEMIGNIAHQWRQPLSVISTGVTGMMFQKDLGTLDDEKFKETCHSINENAQYLSKTIDDFRNFIKGNSKRESFNLKTSIDSFLSLVNSSIKKHNMMVKVEIAEDITINGFQNELHQCLINLFNNSKDALLTTDPKIVFISAYREENELIIVFKDNGGGIDESIIDKVFEPYFTTKHQSMGTGLGLNMTYRLIVEGMRGSIAVMNDTFSYEGVQYTGAKFEMTIPRN